MKGPKQANSQKQEVAYRLSRAREKGGWEVTANGYEVSFWSEENILKLEVMAAQLCEYTKNS